MFEVSDAVHLSEILPGLMILGALAFIGALAIIAFIRIYAIVFLGSPRSPAAENAHELSRGIRLPLAALSLAILITGIFPNVALRFVKPLIRWFGLDMNYFAELQSIMMQVSYVYLILIALFAMFYIIRKLCVKEKRGATWACAYPKVSPRMQSSSMTYVQPLAYFLKPFMYKKTRRLKEEGDFTTKVEYDEEHLDAVWDIIVRPVSRGISKFLLLFSGLHNGKTNSYIAWGLTFLEIGRAHV